MSKTEIQNPLNKSMFKVFLTKYIQIHFFKIDKDQKESLEDLRNLFFPPETTDEVFNNLITFVTKLMDKIIKTEKELEEIFGEINEEYTFDENTFNDIINIVESQKDEIISHLNKDFTAKNINKLDKMNWNTKIILQGNGDNFYEKKYCDIQFAYHNNEIPIKFNKSNKKYISIINLKTFNFI